jgi:hypothetical protein
LVLSGRGLPLASAYGVAFGAGKCSGGSGAAFFVGSSAFAGSAGAAGADLSGVSFPVGNAFATDLQSSNVVTLGFVAVVTPLAGFVPLGGAAFALAGLLETSGHSGAPGGCGQGQGLGITAPALEAARTDATRIKASLVIPPLRQWMVRGSGVSASTAIIRRRASKVNGSTPTARHSSERNGKEPGATRRRVKRPEKAAQQGGLSLWRLEPGVGISYARARAFGPALSAPSRTSAAELKPGLRGIASLRPRRINTAKPSTRRRRMPRSPSAARPFSFPRRWVVANPRRPSYLSRGCRSHKFLEVIYRARTSMPRAPRLDMNALLDAALARAEADLAGAVVSVGG